MNTLTEQILESMPQGPFSSQDVATLFPGSEDRRYALVKRAIAGGEIVHVRRGLYCLAPKYQRNRVNPFAIAQRIYGPSYISLESALSWHGWIPEAVYSIASASFKKSKEFETPLGMFAYYRIPQKVFYKDVQRISDETQSVILMASPLKALADYVYVHKKEWASIEPVVGSLRIDPEELQQIPRGSLEDLISNYSSSRVRRFLDAIGKDLYR